MLLAAALLVGAAPSGVRRSRGITVQGEVAHNSAATLRANVAPRLAGNFFTVDLAAARAAFERVPWVRQAVVRREFPNRLRVLLEEHQAVALWGDEGESRLVNNFGEVFEANVGDVEQDELPRLAGPDGQSAAGAGDVPRAQAAVRAAGPGRRALDADARAAAGRWSWTTAPWSSWGAARRDEVTARTQRFVQTLTQVASRYGRRPRGAGVGRPAPRRRLCGAVEGRRHHGADARRRNERRNRQNMAKEYKDLVVGLDIGTAKVMAVVAEVMPGGELKLAGLGVAAVQRPEEGRGGEHRGHGAEHPARARRKPS